MQVKSSLTRSPSASWCQQSLSAMKAFTFAALLAKVSCFTAETALLLEQINECNPQRPISWKSQIMRRPSTAHADLTDVWSLRNCAATAPQLNASHVAKIRTNRNLRRATSIRTKLTQRRIRSDGTNQRWFYFQAVTSARHERCQRKLENSVDQKKNPTSTFGGLVPSHATYCMSRADGVCR